MHGYALPDGACRIILTSGTTGEPKGVAFSPEMLIGARVLQGISGATLMPATLGLIRTIFVNPPDQKGRAAIEAYQVEKNQHSIDGLPGLPIPADA